jgi:hypothetical protein
MRTNFFQFRTSRIPEVLGRCANDTPYLLSLVNEAIQRLLLEDIDTGWWGTNYRTAFTVTNGFITAPRDVARITDIAVCNQPIRIQNCFFEFLWAGNGLQPNGCQSCNGVTEALDRGVVSTMADLPTGDQYIRVYSTDSRDVTRRIFIQALDENGLVIRTQDGLNWNDGFFLTLDQPFNTSSYMVTKINGIAKDKTYGDVAIYAVDATTGVETLLSRYQADETTPSYRRYYLNNLPNQCCSNTSAVQVIGLAKLDFVPVTKDTDFLLIGNLPALKEECMSIRYSEMESQGSKELADAHHKTAIKLLNKELRTYEGNNNPAINVAVYGTAAPGRVGVGYIR